MSVTIDKQTQVAGGEDLGNLTKESSAMCRGGTNDALFVDFWRSSLLIWRPRIL